MRQEVSYDDLDRVTEVQRYVPPDATSPIYIETYAYNALGGFSIYDGAVVDDQRPRLDGAGKASAAVPATFGGQPVVMDSGGSVTAFNGASLEYFNFDHHVQTLTISGSKQTYTYDSL